VPMCKHTGTYVPLVFERRGARVAG
jgi:hypothetical protein